MHTSKKNRNSGQPQNCIIFYIKIFFLLEKMGLHPTDTNKCEWLLLFHKTELQSCACPGCAKQSGCYLAYSLCNTSQMHWGRPQIVCIMHPVHNAPDCLLLFFSPYFSTFCVFVLGLFFVLFFDNWIPSCCRSLRSNKIQVLPDFVFSEYQVLGRLWVEFKPGFSDVCEVITVMLIYCEEI